VKNTHCSGLSVSIGGFNIIIGPLEAAEKSRGRELLKPFISPVKRGINLEVIGNRPIAGLPSESRVFSSDSHWQLYKLKNNYYYKVVSQEKGYGPIRRLAIFPPDFTCGKIYTNFPARYRQFPLNYPLDQILLIHLSVLNKGILAHACGAVLGQEGILFIGPSGAGKSTIAGLVKEDKQAIILSDDRIIVRKEKDEFRIYGTPWHGTFPDVLNQSAKLKKIFFLKKSPVNQIRRLSPAETNRRLIASSFLPFWDKDFMLKSLPTISELANSGISFELSFKPDKEITGLITNAGF